MATPSALDKLGIPIVLLGSLWAAVSVVFEAFMVINQRRDMIFNLIEKCQQCPDKELTPAFVYWTNLFPLSTGLVVFLVVVTFIMIRLPYFVTFEDQAFGRKMKHTSWLLAMPLLLTLVGFMAGGIVDFSYLVIGGRM